MDRHDHTDLSVAEYHSKRRTSVRPQQEVNETMPRLLQVYELSSTSINHSRVKHWILHWAFIVLRDKGLRHSEKRKLNKKPIHSCCSCCFLKSDKCALWTETTLFYKSALIMFTNSIISYLFIYLPIYLFIYLFGVDSFMWFKRYRKVRRGSSCL